MKYINGTTVVYFALYIFFILFTSQLLFYIAIKKTNNVALFTTITGLYPIITIVLSLLIYNKTVSMKVILGFLLSVIGVYIILK